MKNTLESLKEKLELLDNALNLDHEAKWGRMNAQNMVEHLSLIMAMSTGKFGTPPWDEAKAAKWKTPFFTAERPFPKGIRMPGTVDGQAPPPLKFDSMEAAKGMLKKSFQGFAAHFQKNPEATTVHPFFGPLTYNEWIYFHNKHVEHHLTQFGVLEEVV